MKIAMIEGFMVIFKDASGRDMRDDRPDIKQWPFERKSKNDLTVNDWKKKFNRVYQGFDVDILKGDEMPATGQTKLSTVRDSYSPNDEE